ncbi:MAG: hypothetical protein GC191_00010 [Azospirillum sp.]|nr:hypothetical protein [Azospirillum sp.]
MEPDQTTGIQYTIISFEWGDTRQDYGEERSVLLGMVEHGVHLVVDTERTNNLRIISARRATKHEQNIDYRETAP